jgi:hypothetical protein
VDYRNRDGGEGDGREVFNNDDFNYVCPERRLRTYSHKEF